MSSLVKGISLVFLFITAVGFLLTLVGAVVVVSKAPADPGLLMMALLQVGGLSIGFAMAALLCGLAYPPRWR